MRLAFLSTYTLDQRHELLKGVATCRKKKTDSRQGQMAATYMMKVTAARDIGSEAPVNALELEPLM
jgi:hypothetical protein